MAFKVLTGLFMHETNTFSTVPTRLADFEKLFFHGGPSMIDDLAGTNSETAGFIDAAIAHGWELVPTLAAMATPLGKVTDEAFETVAGAILNGLENAGPVDGAILALHGAMVSDSFDDAESELLVRLRGRLGPDVPIAVTFDLHANIGDATVRAANIVCSYKTYPHIDMRMRARRAGDLLDRAMRREIAPRPVIARRPMLQGADGGRTDVEPMIGLLAEASAFETEPGVLDVSINAGFPQADIWDVGPSVTVTGDGEDPRYQAIAEHLMDRIWATRHMVANRYLSVGEAATLARQHVPVGKPLIIADYADNPGAGSYGDATNLLAALIEAGVEDACFGALVDGVAAAELVAAGAGARITLALGGKTDPLLGGGPLTIEGDIIHAGSGDFVCDGPMWAGLAHSFGPSAVIRTGGIDVLVVTNSMQITDVQQFLANGIDPRKKAVVALKSMQHFRAAYEPIAARVIVCDCGALASPDHRRLAFRKVRRPIYPLDDF